MLKVTKIRVALLIIVLLTIVLIGFFLLRSPYRTYPPFNSERGITFPYEFIDCGDKEENVNSDLINLIEGRFEVLSVNQSDLLLSILNRDPWNNLNDDKKHRLLKEISDKYKETYAQDSNYLFVVECNSSGYKWIGYVENKADKEVLIRFDW